MMILSKPKRLEILKTILVNRILMVFQNQPMLGNVTLNAMAFISIMQGTNLVYQLDFLYLSQYWLLHASKLPFPHHHRCICRIIIAYQDICPVAPPKNHAIPATGASVQHLPQ
jgi:hypothetical protein